MRMGNKPIPTKKFEKWLKKKGLVYKRTESSHDIWDYPDDSDKSLLRPVVFRSAKKDIPPCHIHTNLTTMDIDNKTFDKEIKNI